MDYTIQNMDRKYWWIVVAIAVITFIPFLGEALFNTKGEPREAIVAVSMLQQGNWILPESCGADIPYKPPFLAWCIALVSSIFGGEVTEMTSRLPSAIAMIVMTLVGFRFYSHRTSPVIATIMALLTMTAFEVFRAASACRVDMVLTMFIVTSLYALYRHYERGGKGISWVAVLLMSGGVLTKGPVGMLLPCMVMGVFRLLRGDGFWRTFFVMLASGIASCVIPALWYVAAYQQGGQHFLDLAMEENFGRFFGKMSYESHVNPVHYNFVTVISGWLPYTLLLIFSLFSISYKRKRKTFGVDGLWSRFVAKMRTMDPVKLFSVLSIVVIFVFYCIPKSKRSVYLLPIYPFLAYYITLYIIYLVRRQSKSVKVYASVIAGLAILLIGVFVAIKCDIVPESIFKGKRAAENIGYLHALENVELGVLNVSLLVILVVSAWKTVTACRRQSHMRAMMMAIATIVIIYWNFSAFLQPAVLNVKSDYRVAQSIKNIVPEGKIYSFIDDDYLRFYTINFYTGDRVKLFEREKPENGYVIVGEKDRELFETRYDKEYEFEQVIVSPARSCDSRQPLFVLSFKNKQN